MANYDSKIIYFIPDNNKKPHNASVVVGVSEKVLFNVTFTPQEAIRSQGQIRLTVLNNQYEDTVIQMVGEGYSDEVTLSNIHSIASTNIDPEQEEGNLAEDDVAGEFCTNPLKIPVYTIMIHYLFNNLVHGNCLFKSL